MVEDVHWADSATLDCLTFLARPGGAGAVTVVVTCRGDEAPLDAAGGRVAGAGARRGGGGGDPAGPAVAGGGGASRSPRWRAGRCRRGWCDELYARAEGNPFFTEQLVAAALAGRGGGGLRVPAGLPARLAELLAARAGRCGG